MYLYQSIAFLTWVNFLLKLKKACQDRNAISIIAKDATEGLNCKCRPGYMSADGFGQYLADKNDYCVECIASEKVKISSQEFSIRLDNAKFQIEDNDAAIKLSQDDDDSKQVGARFVQSVGVGSNKNEKQYKFHALKPGQRYNLEMTPTSSDSSLQCSVVTSCSCDQHTDDRTGRPGMLLVDEF